MFRRLAKKCTRSVNSAVNAHLEGMFRFATTRPLRVVFLSLVLLALSGLSIATTRFESNIFSLFPAQTGPLRLFLDSMEWTGSFKDAFFILEGDRERLPAEAEAFGSLAFTDYGALVSIGWATNFGVFATALFALVSLPALMVLSGRRP